MIIKDIKELYKIIQPHFLIKMIIDRYDGSEPFDLSKSWNDIGLDKLDIVEIVMCLEKEYSISIDDDLLDTFDIGLFDLYSNLTSVKRDTILKELGV